MHVISRGDVRWRAYLVQHHRRQPRTRDDLDVGIHARIESVLDFSDAQEEGQAELDLSGAELVASGSVIAPKAFSGWTAPPPAA